MVTIDDLRRATDCAEDVLSALSDAHVAAAAIEISKAAIFVERFVDALFAIEETTEALQKSLPPVRHLFCAVNDRPVEVFGGPFPSAHDAIVCEGLAVGDVAFDIINTARPGYYEAGIPHVCPLLVAKPDVLRHVDIALVSFREAFSSLEQCNVCAAMLSQEQARAIQQIESKTAEHEIIQAHTAALQASASEVEIVQPSGVQPVDYLGISIDYEYRTVEREGYSDKVQLDARLFGVFLAILNANLRGVKCPTTAIIDNWQGTTYEPDDNNVQNAISVLRDRLKLLGLDIQSARNVGYQIVEVANRTKRKAKKK